MEEHVQAAKRRPEEPRGGHADFGVAPDHRDVGHQRHLEATAQRVTADLPHGDLRKAHEVVIEAEGLAVHRQTPPLAGSTFGRLLPRLRRSSSPALRAGGPPACEGSAPTSRERLSPYQPYALFMSAPVLNTPSATRSRWRATVSRIVASYELRWPGLFNVIVAIRFSESTSNKTRSSGLVIGWTPGGCCSKSIWLQWFCRFRQRGCCAAQRRGDLARAAPPAPSRRHEWHQAIAGDRAGPRAWSYATSDRLRRSIPRTHAPTRSAPASRSGESSVRCRIARRSLRETAGRLAHTATGHRIALSVTRFRFRDRARLRSSDPRARRTCRRRSVPGAAAHR